MRTTPIAVVLNGHHVFSLGLSAGDLEFLAEQVADISGTIRIYDDLVEIEVHEANRCVYEAVLSSI